MIKPNNPNSEFELGGINHVALVCSDMEKHRRLLQQCAWHAADQVARPARRHGAALLLRRGQRRLCRVLLVRRGSRPRAGHLVTRSDPGIGDIVSAVSTMNHLAFHVPAEKFDEYRQRLKDKGVRVGPGAQPRRERDAGVADAASRRLRAVVLLPSTLTASRSSSPAGPRNSPRTTRRRRRRPRRTAGPGACSA